MTLAGNWGSVTPNVLPDSKSPSKARYSVAMARMAWRNVKLATIQRQQELSQNRKSLLEQGSAKDKAQISHWDCEANQKGFAA
jgi:hypothetical protein